MAAPNLTRDQAQQRAALLEVDSYRIELDLTDGGGKPGSDTFRSTTTVQPAASAGATFHVESMNGAFHGVMTAAGPDGIRCTRFHVPRERQSRSS